MEHIKTFASMIVLVLFASLLNPMRVNGDDEFRVVKNLAFAKHAPELKLSLYLPISDSQSAEQRTPCVIAIVGGGFSTQTGKRFASYAQYLAKHGFASALVAYRGRPKHTYQHTMEDLDAALAYVRANAMQYDIDPGRIGATGKSAGGTLAALLAVSKRDGKPIQAAVCFAGVFDFVGRFTNQEQQGLQPKLELKRKTNGQWIGNDFSPDSAAWLDASAINHVDSSDPPILFLHCKDDSTVPWLQSRDMHEAMKKNKIASEMRIYATGGHGVSPKTADPMQDMVDFFRKHLDVK